MHFRTQTTRLAVVAGLLAIAGCAAQVPVAHLCVQYGVASWYRPSLARTPTADGQRLGPGTLTAAHPFLPFGTTVRVTDLATGHSVTVRIDDRGPFVSGRIIDLSAAAARRLGMGPNGLARVRLLARLGRSGPAPAGSVPQGVPQGVPQRVPREVPRGVGRCRPGGGANGAI